MTRFLDAPPELYTQLGRVVSRIETVRTLISRLQAAEATLLAEVSEIAVAFAEAEAHPDGAGMAHRLVASEIGAAVRESDRTITTRIARACVLTESYPAVFASLRAGTISAGHAVVITEAGQIITDSAHVAAYEAEVLDYAEHETVGR